LRQTLKFAALPDQQKVTGVRTNVLGNPGRLKDRGERILLAKGGNKQSSCGRRLIKYSYYSAKGKIRRREDLPVSQPERWRDPNISWEIQGKAE